jgi:CHAD domain-containing protein
VTINEIGLELTPDKAIHLFDFALDYFALNLQQDIRMQFDNISKADRSHALCVPQPAAAVKATQLELSKHMTIEQAFQAIANNCLVQIQANEVGVVKERDVESVHQLRVGLRRLRSALGLFRSRLQAPEDVLQELDWLTMELGAARDWDVLAGSTLPGVAEAIPDETGIAEVKLAALARAREMHEAAAAAVGSPRYKRWILHFTRWVQDCAWRNTMAPQDQKRLTAPLMKFARNMLEHQQRRLLKRGSKLPGASPQARHKVRIAAKKIRYATEFFQSLYPSKLVRPYVAALSGLQDALGWLNDAAVACRLLKQLQNGQIQLEASAGFVRGYLASRIKSDDKKIRELWKKFILMKLPC